MTICLAQSLIWALAAPGSGYGRTSRSGQQFEVAERAATVALTEVLEETSWTFQRVTPLEGLQAMTINVARQYGERDSKGSLEPGKLADLVILDRNPLKVEPMAIKDIRVVETIKEGKTIYTRP